MPIFAVTGIVDPAAGHLRVLPLIPFAKGRPHYYNARQIPNSLSLAGMKSAPRRL
jgi:hypothetical protein